MSFVQFVHETDERLMTFVSKLQHPIITSLFLPVTHSIAPFTVISILTLLSFFSLYANIYHKELIFLFFSVFPIVIGSYIKKKVNRVRPSDNIKICVKEKSADFPSTHAAVACSVWGMIAYFQNANSLVINLAILIALLVSFSRCILGVHNPSSIAAGMLLGFLWLKILILGYENIPDYYFHSSSVLFFLIIGWVFIGKYYKKYPEDIPLFLRKPSKIMKRVYTGVLVSLFCFIPIWNGGITFVVLMGAILTLGLFEIFNSCEMIISKVHLKIIGCVFFAAMIYLVIVLRGMESGHWYLLLVVSTSALSDISGWATGTFFDGKVKIPILAKISPNKTLGGYFAALMTPTIIVGSVLALITSIQYQCYAVCFILSFASVAGDLLESFFKRSLGIKDFSNFLPGHGGILDRVDSHLLAASILYFLVATHIFRL